MKPNRIDKRMQRWVAACLSIILLISGMFPILALAVETEDGAIHIQSQEDLSILAENCRLDTWSQGKTVILDQDITLNEDAQAFFPFPPLAEVLKAAATQSAAFLLPEKIPAPVCSTHCRRVLWSEI